MVTRNRRLAKAVRGLNPLPNGKGRYLSFIQSSIISRMGGYRGQLKSHMRMQEKIGMIQRALNGAEADIVSGKKVPESYFNKATLKAKLTAPFWVPIRAYFEHNSHFRGEKKVVMQMLKGIEGLRIHLAPKGQALSASQMRENENAVKELRARLTLIERFNDASVEQFKEIVRRQRQIDKK